ncbi:hypothetical protein [Flagellimonas marinaquae]
MSYSYFLHVCPEYPGMRDGRPREIPFSEKGKGICKWETFNLSKRSNVEWCLHLDSVADS